MTSVADTSREIKKDPSKSKIFWETFKSFDDAFSFFIMAVSLTAFAIAFQLIGFAIHCLLELKVVVFFSGVNLVIGCGTFATLFVALMIVGGSLTAIGAFIERMDNVKERYK